MGYLDKIKDIAKKVMVDFDVFLNEKLDTIKDLIETSSYMRTNNLLDENASRVLNYGIGGEVIRNNNNNIYPVCLDSYFEPNLNQVIKYENNMKKEANALCIDDNGQKYYLFLEDDGDITLHRQKNTRAGSVIGKIMECPENLDLYSYIDSYEKRVDFVLDYIQNNTKSVDSIKSDLIINSQLQQKLENVKNKEF